MHGLPEWKEYRRLLLGAPNRGQHSGMYASTDTGTYHPRLCARYSDNAPHTGSNGLHRNCGLHDVL